MKKIIGSVFKEDVSTATVCLTKSLDESIGPMKIHSVAYPEKSLSDSDFKYTPACSTNLEETFRRAREKFKQVSN